MNGEILAALRSIFRIGKVVSTNPETCTARVQFLDADGLVSDDLQILNSKTLADKDYSMYDIDEQVACIFLGNGPSAGYILGALYSQKTKPNESSQDVWAKEFKDGTKIRYDREEHRLEVTVNGDTDVYVQKDKTISVDGSVNVEAGVDLNFNATGDMNVDASTANISCPEVNLGTGAAQGVIHAASPCPLFGVFHLLPSQTTKTAL